jgi:copper chaperone
MLITLKGNTCASVTEGSMSKSPGLFETNRDLTTRAVDFRPSVPEIPRCVFTAQSPGRLPQTVRRKPFRGSPEWDTRDFPSLLPLEGIASGVMKGLAPRHKGMNKPKLADTAQVHTTRAIIDGMSCGACVRHVTRALDGLTGVVRVQVDLQRNQARVEHLPDQADERSLIAAIEAAGYKARVEATSDGASDPSESPAAGRSTGCCCG